MGGGGFRFLSKTKTYLLKIEMKRGNKESSCD